MRGEGRASVSWLLLIGDSVTAPGSRALITPAGGGSDYTLVIASRLGDHRSGVYARRRVDFGGAAKGKRALLLDHGHGSDPALTVALALAFGLIAQALAQHARIPGIVLLLLTGAILGPDVLGLVQPEALGPALQTLVGYAVAVILFEGGLNLDIRRLQRESAAIQRLITIGALVTLFGAAVAARVFMGWEWRLSLLFGTLVIVTGPTVIGPLLRRIRIKKSLQTVLEAEGVLIDPVGAIIAIVALDVALSPSFPSIAMGILGVVASLGVGCLIGLIGGFIVAQLLSAKRLIPEGLENVFALSMILALFHIANVFQPESGIASVTIAGVVVGNKRTRVHRDLMEFKEQLTVMLIGMLFVILAADVRFEEIRALGLPGLLITVSLMLIVRPLNIAVSTTASGLSIRDKTFLAWIAPRGIVAAAVASFFAVELDKAGIPGGSTLRAMVFLVIATTVTVQGLTGGFVAKLLGVRRASDQGFAILGANSLGLVVGRALRARGEDVVFLDSNVDASHAAERDNFRVLFGNGLEDSLMQRAELDGLAGCIGLTSNEEVNLLFVSKAREEFKVPRASVTLHLNEGHLTPALVHAAGGTVLFGGQIDIRLWDSCARRGLGTPENWRYGRSTQAVAEGGGYIPAKLNNAILPLVLQRGGRSLPVNDTLSFRQEDEVTFLIFRNRRDEAVAWLGEQGWDPARAEETASEVTSV
jgi:NhaP-type Na+/H+ or K+/H+ antiporter